jgi:hypothetical protein
MLTEIALVSTYNYRYIIEAMQSYSKVGVVDLVLYRTQWVGIQLKEAVGSRRSERGIRR